MHTCLPLQIHMSSNTFHLFYFTSFSTSFPLFVQPALKCIFCALIHMSLFLFVFERTSVFILSSIQFVFFFLQLSAMSLFKLFFCCYLHLLFVRYYVPCGYDTETATLTPTYRIARDGSGILQMVVVISLEKSNSRII